MLRHGIHFISSRFFVSFFSYFWRDVCACEFVKQGALKHACSRRDPFAVTACYDSGATSDLKWVPKGGAQGRGLLTPKSPETGHFFSNDDSH